ncbi:MAG: lysophospholipase [Clostridium sp.]|nr:lysophospholipase [Bacteroides sp.]MCM1198301.1 lysophospholipase [Clostridium sp.]
MTEKNISLKASSDDINLSVLHIAPESTPKAIVQIVHGMCEHKERYTGFMHFLAGNGYACVIHDHRGHGASVKSSDDLGYFYDGGFSAMVDDVHIVTLWAKQQWKGLPLILFGHSMGSMVVRSYTKRYDNELAGLFVCGSPSRNPAAGIGKALASLAGMLCGDKSRPRLIQKIAFGSFNSRIKKPVSPNSWICSDPEIVAAYDANPLCNYQFTANGFRNLFSLMQDTYSMKGWKLANPNMPIRFIAGENDPCIAGIDNFEKAVDFMKKAGYRNVTSILYPGMRHEILNEIGKEMVWNDVLTFIGLWTSLNVPEGR